MSEPIRCVHLLIKSEKKDSGFWNGLWNRLKRLTAGSTFCRAPEAELITCAPLEQQLARANDSEIDVDPATRKKSSRRSTPPEADRTDDPQEPNKANTRVRMSPQPEFD